MARPCSVCVHDSRLAIEQAILARKPASQIARNFGFTYTRKTGPKAGEVVADHRVITRHRDEHMGKAYATAVAESESASGAAMVNRLAFLDEQVDHAISEARKGRVVEVEGVAVLDEDTGHPMRVYDLRLLLAAVREARGNIEVALKLSGRTEHDPQSLDRLREQLANPEARKLLAELDALMAKHDQDKPGADVPGAT